MSEPRSVSLSTHAPIAPAGPPAGATVCTACALLCDDGVVHRVEGRFERLCGRGADAFRCAAAATCPAATIDGRPAAVAAAIATAAGRRGGARRVLVTGLNDVTIEGVTAACDVAETLGAALSPAGENARHPGGPTIARCGEITAAWEELRDRADLVIFWGHDPAGSQPRFVERFVAPPLPHPRRTIAVGTTPLCDPPSSDHAHLLLDDDDDDVDLARLLLASILDRPRGTVSPRLEVAAAALREAIDTARCVAFVTGRPDPHGLSRCGVIEIVRALSRRLPAFEIPLDAPPLAPNAAGAALALTWRYGTAAGALRAVAGGAATIPPSRPVDALGLVTAGGVDAILAVGRLPPRLDDLIRGQIDPRGVIRIAPAIPDGAGDGVFLRCRELFDETGTLLRADGRTVELAGGADDSLPSAVALLAAIHQQLVATTAPGPEGGTA